MTTTIGPVTLAWIASGSKDAGMKVPSSVYAERAVAHLRKWEALTAAAVADADKRLAAETAEGIPFPPVYKTAENYRERTVRSAVEDSVRGIWTPDEMASWGATTDAVLAEWGIDREAVQAAIR